MAEITFDVPSGKSCENYPHQENFSVSELECTTMEDRYPRYIRVIVANCHLFNEPIQGTIINKMEKCVSCKRKTEV